MGWLSRTFTPAAKDGGATAVPSGTGDNPAAPTPPTTATTLATPATPATPTARTASNGPAAPSTPTTNASTPTGRYGPLVSVTRFDTAPPELEWQLPLNGELYRLMPGADRPDYSLLVLERPLHFYPAAGFDLGRVEPDQRVEDRKGRTMVRVHALLLCARYVGQQLHPGMTDLAVNLAYVIDNSLARDAEVDFGKIEVAATGFLSEGHTPRPGAASATTTTPTTAMTPDAAPVPEPAQATAEQVGPPRGEVTSDDEGSGRHTPSGALDELATILRRGVEEQRGVPVRRMTAVLTVDGDHRLTGLSGNADGQAPVPTPETFGRLAEALTRLAGADASAPVAAVTLRVDGDVVGHEVTATHEAGAAPE
jgi:hypothetical protein